MIEDCHISIESLELALGQSLGQLSIYTRRLIVDRLALSPCIPDILTPMKLENHFNILAANEATLRYQSWQR